jgi:hypothetical protein
MQSAPLTRRHWPDDLEARHLAVTVQDRLPALRVVIEQDFANDGGGQ